MGVHMDEDRAVAYLLGDAVLQYQVLFVLCSQGADWV